MTTKTLTIMEDAYNLLAAAKKEEESFSDVIRRITKKRDLKTFLGVIDDKTGKRMLDDLKTIKEKDIAMQKGRL